MLAEIVRRDVKDRKIPDQLNAALFAVGVLSVFTMDSLSIIDRSFGIFAVSLPMLAAACAFPGGIGGGDIKLMAAGGMALGVKGIILAAEIGFFAGALYSIFLLAVKKEGRKKGFPFAPFLCAGLAVSFVILCVKSSYSIL